MVEADGTWRLDPTDVKAYEAQLLTLRDAAEAVEDHRTIRARITAESVTVVGPKGCATGDSS